MLSEETAVLRAAYAYADALKRFNETVDAVSKRAYEASKYDLFISAADLMDVDKEKRSVV